jgi:hypothetical protein
MQHNPRTVVDELTAKHEQLCRILEQLEKQIPTDNLITNKYLAAVGVVKESLSKVQKYIIATNEMYPGNVKAQEADVRVQTISNQMAKEKSEDIAYKIAQIQLSMAQVYNMAVKDRYNKTRSDAELLLSDIENTIREISNSLEKAKKQQAINTIPTTATVTTAVNINNHSSSSAILSSSSSYLFSTTTGSATSATTTAVAKLALDDVKPLINKTSNNTNTKSNNHSSSMANSNKNSSDLSLTSTMSNQTSDPSGSTNPEEGETEKRFGFKS